MSHTPNHSNQGGREDLTERSGENPGAWLKLSWEDRLVVVATLVVVAVAALPLLPPGICFGDAGDLQLASATLGIMHPPGYPGYVTVGYLATCLPGFDPAYLVSLACLSTGLVSLAVCMLMQIRLGVNPWVSGVLCLALVGHPRVWHNLIAPEVYLPTLALLVCAAYLLLKHARCGARRALLGAACLVGLAVANRPTTVLWVPFCLLAWRSAGGNRTLFGTRSRRSVALAAALAAAPFIYTPGYLWVRDRPDIGYNYIEHSAASADLPDASAGFGARLERVYWQASAAQFREYLGDSWAGVWKKLRWVRHELIPQEHVLVLCVALTIVLFGAYLTFRRSRTAGWLLCGFCVSSLVFVCLYRVHGQSADLLPLLFAGAVLGGVAVSTIVPRQAGSFRRALAICALALCAVATLRSAPTRPGVAAQDNALPYLAAVDMLTLPENALVCSIWPYSPPLWYARSVLTSRDDVEIINTRLADWLDGIDELPPRPVFSVVADHDVAGYSLTPYRNLWRVRPRPD